MLCLEPIYRYDCDANCTVQKSRINTQNILLVQISEDTKNRRVRASKNVRTAIQNKTTGKAVRRFVVTIPDVSEHQFHAVGEVDT